MDPKGQDSPAFPPPAPGRGDFLWGQIPQKGDIHSLPHPPSDLSEKLIVAIRQKYGQDTAGREQLGPLLDTLAILRDTAGALTLQLTRQLAAHPVLTQGSEYLTVEDRIQHTMANRRAIHSMLKENRPVSAPEVFIMAGAQVALGGSAQDLGAGVVDSVQTPGLREQVFRDRLEHPEHSPTLAAQSPADAMEYELGQD